MRSCPRLPFLNKGLSWLTSEQKWTAGAFRCNPKSYQGFHDSQISCLCASIWGTYMKKWLWVFDDSHWKSPLCLLNNTALLPPCRKRLAWLSYRIWNWIFNSFPLSALSSFQSFSYPSSNMSKSLNILLHSVTQWGVLSLSLIFTECDIFSSGAADCISPGESEVSAAQLWFPP